MRSVLAQSWPRIPEGKRGGASDEVTLSQNRGAVNIAAIQQMQVDLGISLHETKRSPYPGPGSWKVLKMAI